MKRILWTIFGLMALTLFFLFRPGLTPPEIVVPDRLPELAFDVSMAELAIQQREEKFEPLKEDNHTRIIWASSYEEKKAPCSVVYIHGFTASYGEGDPFHRRVAEALGCHLYIPRLHAHGRITDEPMLDINADSLLADAVHSLAVAQILGERVLVMGNSMGGLFSVFLASSFPEEIDGLVLLAPLLEFAMPEASLFDTRWGQRIMRMRLRSRYLDVPVEHEKQPQYWYTQYRIESLMTLKTLKETLLTDSVYSSIVAPVFVGYYYKDEENQDNLVSVTAIENMKHQLGTPDDLIRFEAFPDAGNHVITSRYRTNVYEETAESVIAFFKESGVLRQQEASKEQP
ncbi:alpha/beta hydrolase [Balneolaceae bacterium ANBcel3]|nr:alpha/beta hydrolase [Balneolaceae bacterium ANBcel3]